MMIKLNVCFLPRSIKAASFTIRKRTVNGPYRWTWVSGAEIRTVFYPYRKRTVFGRFPEFYGENTVSRFGKYYHPKRS